MTPANILRDMMFSLAMLYKKIKLSSRKVKAKTRELPRPTIQIEIGQPSVKSSYYPD